MIPFMIRKGKNKPLFDLIIKRVKSKVVISTLLLFLLLEISLATSFNSPDSYAPLYIVTLPLLVGSLMTDDALKFPSRLFLASSIFLIIGFLFLNVKLNFIILNINIFDNVGSLILLFGALIFSFGIIILIEDLFSLLPFQIREYFEKNRK